MAIKHVQADPEAKKAIACPFRDCDAKPMKLRLCVIEGERILKWFVYCAECGGAGPEKESEADAVKAWNERSGIAPAIIDRRAAKLILLFIALACLLGCATAPAKTDVIRLEIHNRTRQAFHGMILTSIPPGYQLIAPAFGIAATMEVDLEAEAIQVLEVPREYVPRQIIIDVLEQKGGTR